MKLYILIILLLSALLTAGCEPEAEDTAPPVPPGFRAGLTEEEAATIAQNSVCTEEGSLTNNIYYNENTRTWWIDLELEKEGCNPACVVDEETKTAEINWRCTGLIID